MSEYDERDFQNNQNQDWSNYLPKILRDDFVNYRKNPRRSKEHLYGKNLKPGLLEAEEKADRERRIAWFQREQQRFDNPVVQQTLSQIKPGGNQLVFIDSAIEDPEVIIENLSGSPEIIFLDQTGEDEVFVIGECLRAYQQVDGVHIFSHGQPGQISFANAELNQQTLPQYKESIAGWRNFLSQDADIIFYGCDVASGESGDSLIQDISQITGADILASVDQTGKDGDWDLETAVGEIEATSSIVNPEMDTAYQDNLLSEPLSPGGGGGMTIGTTQDSGLDFGSNNSYNNDFSVNDNLSIDTGNNIFDSNVDPDIGITDNDDELDFNKDDNSYNNDFSVNDNLSIDTGNNIFDSNVDPDIGINNNNLLDSQKSYAEKQQEKIDNTLLIPKYNFDNGFDFSNHDSGYLNSYIAEGKDFQDLTPETISRIDFNSIPAENLQIMADKGLRLDTLDPATVNGINLGTLSNLKQMPEVDLSLTNFSPETTFDELSSSFVDRSHLFSYKDPSFEIEKGLTIPKLSQINQSDLKALDFSFTGSETFDAEFYITQYPDIKQAGVNPFAHYMETGYNEGRKPNAGFDTTYYLAKNPDVAQASVNPLKHHKEFGEKEGRYTNAEQEQRDIASEVMAGALLGDYNSDPTFWSTVAQIATGVIPYAGQAADIRDISKALQDIEREEGKNPGSWINLILTSIGVIPGGGDLISKLGQRGVDILAESGITKRIGPLLDSEVIQKIINGARGSTEELVGKVKDAVLGELVKIRDAAKQAGQQVSQEIDRAIDDLLGDRPLAAVGGPNPGNQTGKQPVGNNSSGANQSGKQPESGETGSAISDNKGVDLVANPKDKALLSSVREGFIDGSVEFGEKLGEGGFGAVYKIKGKPNLAIKIPLDSKGLNNQLIEESANLSDLTQKGYQTVYKGLIEWTDANGIVKQGIVMERVEGALSKQILRVGKYADEASDPALEAIVTPKTIEDLQEFREIAKNDDIVIDDLQFMVTNKDGSIKLVDPARIDNLPAKGKKRRQALKSYLKRIDGLIGSFKQILDTKKN